MTERIVRPIRAWAEYDEWSVFMDHYTGIASDERWFYDAHLVPKGANGACTGHGGFRGIADFFGDEPKPLGPLRSLRVLYENGATLILRQWPAYSNGPWKWDLWDHGGAHRRMLATGDFPEDKDSEAVERAMVAAAAWFSQAQMESVK
jgi:hypothetical protein